MVYAQGIDDGIFKDKSWLGLWRNLGLCEWDEDPESSFIK